MAAPAHSHPPADSLTRLLIAIVINSGIVIFEITWGLVTGSMALISDAVHNLSDIAALALGFWSEKVARRPADKQKTYGYKKIEFITAFANSIFLSVAITFVFYEAILRLFHPVSIQSDKMFLVALIALLGNSVATLVLQKTARQNFNLKAVWLHSLQDALLSLGVVIASVVISFTGWNVIDPALSIVICLFIAREIFKIISHAVNALLDAVPDDIDFDEVKLEILKVNDVQEVADLHIWQTDSQQKMLSAHVQILPDTDSQKVLASVQKVLRDRYDIHHLTLQIVPCDTTRRDCQHCN